MRFTDIFFMIGQFAIRKVIRFVAFVRERTFPFAYVAGNIVFSN